MQRRGLKRFTALVVFLLSVSMIAMALWDGIVWPTGGGTVKKDGSLSVDSSNASDGYIMCKAKESSKRYKLRIAKDGVTLTYDLNKEGKYEVFPLQLGNGKYKISLYKNSSGNKYSAGGEMTLSVSMDDEKSAFLVPTQYIQYDEKTSAVLKSDELCAGLTSNRQKFEAIRKWIKENFLYDYIKAVTVERGTLPDIEGTMEKKMGICQDLAAIAACMLRVQGIPTQVAIGYRDDDYHAWNYVYLDGEYEMYDPTTEVNGIKKKGTYTLERYY